MKAEGTGGHLVVSEVQERGGALIVHAGDQLVQAQAMDPSVSEALHSRGFPSGSLLFLFLFTSFFL